jgi:NAD(P)H-dependent FMN reductase
MSDTAPVPLHLLAISGSLRAGASNTALLEAAALVAPPGVTIALYDALSMLPPFNPDLDAPDGVGLPPAVADFRTRIGRADGLLLSSPEYAHGIAGAFKNALDWLVGSVEFPGKPVAVLNASPWSVHAPAQLIEVLTTMNAHLVPEACVAVPLRGQRLDGATVAADPELAPVLRAAVAAFVRAMGGARQRRDSLEVTP